MKILLLRGGLPAMVVEHDDAEDVELGNGDTLAERLEKVNLQTDETCSIQELREQLGL